MHCLTVIWKPVSKELNNVQNQRITEWAKYCAELF